METTTMEAHKSNSRLLRFTGVLMALLTVGFFTRVSPQTPPETPPQALDRAHQAHGGLWRSGQIVDWVAQGQIALLGDRGGPYNVTLLVKGRDKVQRIVVQPGGEVHYGANGTRSWQKSGPFNAPAAGRVADFVDSHTIRSMQRAFNYPTEGLVLRDLGTRMQDLGPNPAPCRVIEAQDTAGRKTRYYIDNAASLVTRLEFEPGGTYRSAFGSRLIPNSSTLVFSDYRVVAGVTTPFRIDFYKDAMRIEQITFTTVQYNVGLLDTVFTP